MISDPNECEAIRMGSKSEEYERQATECERRAKDSADAIMRAHWLRLAAEWRQFLKASRAKEAVQLDHMVWPPCGAADSKSSH
jgi:hypothetical protein